MREPLTDDEIRRIARETSRETVRRLTDLLIVIGLLLLGLWLLPILIVTTANAFVPPLGQTASPVMGLVFAAAFVIYIIVLVRLFATLRRR